jgi:hypothetical protein
MALYHLGPRDDRRRRVLNETSLGTLAPPAPKPRKRRAAKGWLGKSKNYGDAEFLDEQPRVTDLVPVRMLPIVAWFSVAFGCVAGLEALYAGMPQIASATGPCRIAAFDLAAKGSLATWFSSLLLLLATLAAIVVYTIRRHKNDDYHGRYRIWIWAACCWTLMSVDEVSNLHEAFRDLMVRFCGTPLLGDGSIWWLILGFFLFGSVGLRLLVDMRFCRASCSAMVLASLCYALAAACHFGLVVAGEAAQQVMIAAGAKMAGHLLLLSAIVLYGRHVILDAQGLISQEQPRPKKKPAKRPEDDLSSSDDDDDDLKIHPPHSGVPKPAMPLAFQPAASSTTMSTSPSTSGVAAGANGRSVVGPGGPAGGVPPPATANAGQRKLSKEERRALKKKLMQMKKQRGGGQDDDDE